MNRKERSGIRQAADIIIESLDEKQKPFARQFRAVTKLNAATIYSLAELTDDGVTLTWTANDSEVPMKDLLNQPAASGIPETDLQAIALDSLLPQRQILYARRDQFTQLASAYIKTIFPNE